MPGIYSAHDAIIGVQSALGGRGGGLRYLLRDEFTTDRAAGAVNGTAAEPGPGTRTVVDVESKITISSDALQLAPQVSAAYGDEELVYPPIARTAGRFIIAESMFAGIASTDESAFGLWKSASGNSPANAGTIEHFLWFYRNGALYARSGTTGPSQLSYAASTSYKFAIVLRTTGVFWFIKGGAFTNWTLFEITNANTTATLYPAFVGYNRAFSSQYIRIPDTLWLPTPLVSDGYGSNYGISDGYGHAEGIAGGIGAGGSGVTWSNAGGTWSTSGGKAINTSPSGLVQQISVANLSCADVYAGASVVRALSQQVGLALNWDSASSPANGLLVYSDGAGNIKVDKYVSGSPTNVSTTAFTYSAGARLVCTMNAGALRVYYNDALITTATIVDAGILTGQFHGLFSSDASNTLDDLTIYATGTGGEYSQLDSY